MSPTFAAKPRAGPAAAAAVDDVGDRFAPLALLGPLQDDDPAAQWKAQRKLKHARDFSKRHSSSSNAAALKPRFKQHGHHGGGHHGIPLQELRRERDLWLASEQQLAQSSNGRSIPDHHRRDKASASAAGAARAGLSKSVPATAPASWPPASGVTRDDDDDDDELSLLDENDHPNSSSSRRWSSLSSSAPKESSASALSRSSSSKREARPMTLFESASFFNESGHLLSHDNFEELGSSPEMAKRKLAKRRVGRRKTTTDKTTHKRDSPDDAFNREELVLELMAQLLPHVDVGKELNLRLLTGQPRAAVGDVFHFEHDDSDALGLKPKAKNAPLEIDVLKFQAALTKMVFGTSGTTGAGPSDEPLTALQSLDGDDLAEHVLSDHWVTQTLLATVQLDVLVQYDRFAVLLALFRALPHRRRALLDAVTATALAIFHHQGADATRGQFADVECVNVKGLVAFLSALLGTLEYDARMAADTADDDDAIATHAYCCDQLSRTLELLLRSSPGKPRRPDESNLLDKYSEDSLSLEATTYGALGEVLAQLAALSPVHGERLLRWLVRKWPARNVQLQLFFVRFTGKLLVQFLRCGLCLPADVVAKAFAHVAASITSPHFLIAQEACSLCGDMALMDVYLSRDPAVRAAVASALHQNARAHWNDRIREVSDEHFDMLLDLA